MLYSFYRALNSGSILSIFDECRNVPALYYSENSQSSPSRKLFVFRSGMSKRALVSLRRLVYFIQIVVVRPHQQAAAAAE